MVACGDAPDSIPHILAEVVRDAAEAESERETTLATAICGARSVVTTAAELTTTAAGRRALESWNGGDDAEFNLETVRLLGADEPTRPTLRLVSG